MPRVRSWARLAWTMCLMAGGVHALTPSPGAAQDAESTVRSAHLMALVEADGTVRVSLEYGLDPMGADEVPIVLLGFGDATVDVVHVLGGDSSIVMWPASGSRRAAAIAADLPRSVEGDRMVLRYRVENALSFDGETVRGHVPVAAVDWKPVQGGGAEDGPVFTAEVALPPEWVLTESFPTGLKAADGETAHRVTLPAVPAVVSFRARTDGRWRPGFPLAIDLIALLIFVSFSFVGWRHLSRIAR